MSTEIKGLSVVSNARKVVFALSKGPITSFPKGVTVSDYGQNNEQPVIVVENGTDGTWQGADAAGFIIVNEVPEDSAVQALDLLKPTWWDLLSGKKPINTVKRALAYLKKQGYVDQYTTKADFYESKLSPAGTMVGKSGIMKRDDRDITQVFYDQNGDLRVQVTDGGVRDIKLDILMRTYRNADGSPIDADTIPTQNIPEDQLLAS